MTFVQTWDETFPSDTQLASYGADDIRRLTQAVRERLAVDHYALAVEAGDPKIGFHNKVTLVDQVVDLLGVTGATRLFSKTVGGVIELFLVHPDNSVHQLTSNGGLSIESLYIAGAILGDFIRYDGAKWTRYSHADLIALLNGLITFPYLPGGSVQVVNYQTGAPSTGVTPLPFDNTVPLNTEGDEYMTLAITPTSATNKLKIDVVLNGLAGNDYCNVALFQDANPNALCANAYIAGHVNWAGRVNFTYFMTAGTVAETTFKVRAGDGAAGTFQFNGNQYDGAKFGGVYFSSITITEVKV